MTLKIREISYLLLALCLLLSADTLQVQAKKKPRVKYHLVFHDEFNQPDGSQPDSTVWSRAPRAKNLWAKWNSDLKDVVYIKNGKLICRAIPNTILLNDTAKMLAGAVNTRNKFSFKYGRVEVKMKTNGKKGNFPAAWMRPEKDGKPYRYGEIDIVEYFGDEKIARQTIHSHRSVILNKKDIPNEFNTNVKDRTKWHVYAIEWSDSEIKTFVDGNITGCYVKSSDDGLLAEGQWSFDSDFFLILNQSVGYGNWYTPNLHDVYETEFDWVRVYQKL